MNAQLFPTPAKFRAWLKIHHTDTKELHVAFYKQSSGKVAMTYREAVDEALCFGWIDGIIRRIDDERYCHRFTPRRPGSIWSNVNVGHVQRLTAAGQMHPAGLAAFAARRPEKTGTYLFEKKEPAEFSPALARKFRAQRSAWDFFQAQPPGYRRLYTHWVTSAKQETTRERRLNRLLAASAAGKRLN